MQGIVNLALCIYLYDRSIVIKQADKGYCVVVWFRDDYIKEANKQLEGKTVYKDIKFKETILSDLVDKSNRIFISLYTCKFITEKKLKYVSYDFKKVIPIKLYLLPKIHKRLYNMPGRHVISNCGAPTEKASEFLDFYSKPLMQSGFSYVRDFIDNMKRIGKVLEVFLSSNCRCGRSISKNTTQRGDCSIKKQIRRTNLLKPSY